MKRRKEPPSTARLRQKTQLSNLIRYTTSGTYFARLPVNGKLIRSGRLCCIRKSTKVTQQLPREISALPIHGFILPVGAVHPKLARQQARNEFPVHDSGGFVSVQPMQQAPIQFV